MVRLGNERTVFDEIHDWFREKKWRTWLSHALIVFGIGAAVLLLPDYVAAFLAVVLYILREMFTGGEKWDKLGDVVGPLVGYAIAVLLFG